MNRIDIIETVGKSYLKTNIENGEYSYAKALKAIGKNYVDYLTDDAKSKHKDIDLRFVDKGLTILIETKSKLTNSNFNKDRNQLQNYVLLEKELTGNKVIAILMATSNDSFKIWQDGSDEINEDNWDSQERTLRTMNEYKNRNLCTKKYTKVR